MRLDRACDVLVLDCAPLLPFPEQPRALRDLADEDCARHREDARHLRRDHANALVVLRDALQPRERKGVAARRIGVEALDLRRDRLPEFRELVGGARSPGLRRRRVAA